MLSNNLPGEKPITRPEPIVKADRLAWLYFEKPDLARQASFLRNFGFRVEMKNEKTLYARGAGEAPVCYIATQGKKARFVGSAFAVLQRSDLVALSEATGVPITPLATPGGGESVRLTDPNGFVVEVINGQQNARPMDTRQQAYRINTPFDQVRVNQPARPPLKPSQIVRLGHLVMQTPKSVETIQWYMRHLGLIPTDVQYLDNGEPMLTFLRLDRGDKPADHHSLVVATGLLAHYDHSAYEVIDVDAIGQGQQVLKAAGYKHMWGIGRHRLGSQLFDYWKDPDGHIMEHYADGDLFTADYPTQYSNFEFAGIWTWGMDLPKGFGLEPSLKMFGALLRLLTGDESGRRRLGAMLRVVRKPARPWL